MAKKFEYMGLPAYQEGPFAIFKRIEDGLWRVHHIRTGQKSMGNITPYAQKRDALTLAQNLCRTSINWEFESEEEMFSLNSENVLINELNPILRKG